MKSVIYRETHIAQYFIFVTHKLLFSFFVTMYPTFSYFCFSIKRDGSVINNLNLLSLRQKYMVHYQAIHCIHCQERDLQKNGKSPSSTQRWYCKVYKKYFRLEYQVVSRIS